MVAVWRVPEGTENVPEGVERSGKPAERHLKFSTDLDGGRKLGGGGDSRQTNC